MIEIYSGKPGSGKTLSLADKIHTLLARNIKYHKRSKIVRLLFSNVGLEKTHIDRLYGAGTHDKYIRYWKEPEELLEIRDVDIIWDEIATHLDSTQWANVPLDLKRFLQQHRKRGIDIYGTTQAFAMVDVSMRRLVDSLWVCYKLLGSANPSATKPAPNWLWGVIWQREIEATTFEDEKPKYTDWSWIWITGNLVKTYDTRQEIPTGALAPLRHIVRKCGTCGVERLTHA